MGGGGGNTVTEVAADLPDIINPIAPERTSAEAMPENFDQALMTSGAKTTASEKEKKNLGTSRLVIPLEGTAQSGGYTEPRKPTGVV